MTNVHADVLLVTATKIESETVLDVFEEATRQKAQPTPIEDRIYFDLGAVNGARVFMVQSEMGAGGWGFSQRGLAGLLRGLGVLLARAGHRGTCVRRPR